MDIRNIKIGDEVTCINEKFPMEVVGLRSTLKELTSGEGIVYADFVGNENGVYKYSAKELKIYHEE
ncbi:hypothetical protein [Prevotella jejuni]|jgi:hypothetical protein|uniref:hypothetical protein n=1 Tax=Prevotella jejuni TaxID=1177574 RepID=UPI002070ABCA|nr:MAG TPA: hypothetical protein [Caudoviricetes sp.]